MEQGDPGRLLRRGATQEKARHKRNRANGWSGRMCEHVCLHFYTEVLAAELGA